MPELGRRLPELGGRAPERKGVPVLELVSQCWGLPYNERNESLRCGFLNRNMFNLMIQSSNI